MTFQTFSPRPGVSIAFHRFDGASLTLPGVVFMGGFKSDMTGTKATHLEEQCKRRNQSFVRFDYTGHGSSSGDFKEGNISHWLQDSQNVLDELTTGPQILVGSSMGGWLALLLALSRLDRICGLTLLAAAPDFSEDIYWQEFGEEERRHLARTGLIYRPSDYGEPYPLTAQLFEDGRKHLLLHGKINIPAPVRLIHGRKDPDVPWQKSERIRAALTSGDVRVIYVDDGDHRLSKPHDLETMDAAVVELSHLHQLATVAKTA
ncbi:MAG: alpha/beta hydrolase [Micavibrio sp.]|nr:alpha/beta hydrolase [Micavibrio sp.]